MAKSSPAAIAAAADAVAAAKTRGFSVAATRGLVHVPRIKPTADAVGLVLPSLVKRVN